jgi:nucleotide-binding universal stress UspA family protein
MSKSGHLAGARAGEHRQHSRMSSDPTAAQARPTPISSATARSAAGARPGYRQVLLATDMGPSSVAATEEAMRLAGALGARLLAISVIDPRTLQLPGGRFRSRVDQERGRLEAAAAELVMRGRRDQVATSFLIWEGDPAESIVDAAQSEGADIIVIGSHGRAALGRALIGSVSDQVVRHAPCPVMVVRSAVGKGT